MLFSHSASLLHDNGSHPESARRIEAIMAALDAADLDLERRESPLAARDELEAVHDPALVTLVERLCAAGGGHLDPDTAVSEGSWEAALRAAGGAIAMTDALVGRSFDVGFSVHRPPGHHAESGRAMGFCLFNHVAVAAQHAIARRGIERVAILDFDVHHGNGTQEIFWERPEVHFCSVHQFPFYPGTGAASERGGGEGRGRTLNLPLAAGAGDAELLHAVEQRWVDAVAAFEPQLILVSAGFDAHRADPLAACLVGDEGFAAVGTAVLRAARALGAPVGVVLEGGYDVAALARSFVAFAAALTAESRSSA